MRARIKHMGLAGAVAAALGLFGLRQAEAESPNEPSLQLSSAQDVPPVTPWRYRVIPEVDPDPDPGSLLERRLAAVAAAVETQIRSGLRPAGLVEFDVEGLAASLEQQLARLEDQAQVSVHVRDLESQHVLFDYYGDTPLNPASNQKLLTSSVALDLLGPDYVFTTEVARDGKDLVLIGRGDPMLDHHDLRDLANLVAEQVDLAEFERLVVDDTAFGSRLAPGYSDEGPGYAWQARSGALSLDFNSVEVTVYPVSGSRAPAVRVDPPSSHVRVVNRARVGSGPGPWVVSTQDGDTTVIEVSGRISSRSAPVVLRRRVSDPALFTGGAFAEMLAELTASEPLPVVRGTASSHSESLLINESTSLFEILGSGLAYSNNFISEQVLRTVAWRMTGDPDDVSTAQDILYQYWNALDRGSEVVIENASGLSRQGRLTTSGLVDLISLAHRTAPAGASLIDALPVAGEPGTLRSRLRVSGKRVRAKTGTLSGVSGLTGVITSEAGEPQLAFSILINVADDTRGLVASRRRRIEDEIVLEVLAALDDYEARRTGIVEG